MTVAEILAAIAADTNLKKELLTGLKTDIQASAQVLGLVIRTPDEDKTFVDNQLAAQLDAKLEEKFAAKYKQSLDEQDALILEHTGVPKQEHSTTGPNEKTKDYLKRALGVYKEKNKSPQGSERVAELERLLRENEEKHKKEIKELKDQAFTSEVSTGVKTALNGRSIIVPAHLKTDKEKQDYITEQREMLEGRFLQKFKPKKLEDGRIAYLGPDGKALMKNDGTYKEPSDLIEESFTPYFLPKGHEQPGGGTPPAGGDGKFASTKQIHEHLAKQGVASGTKKYMDEFEKLVKENKLEAMVGAKETAPAT